MKQQKALKKFIKAFDAVFPVTVDFGEDYRDTL